MYSPTRVAFRYRRALEALSLEDLHRLARPWYGRYNPRDPEVIRALRELGRRFSGKTPSVVYRGVHLEGPVDVALPTYASGVRSWSKSRVFAKYYATWGAAPRNPVGIIYEWAAPVVILDCDRANRAFKKAGLDPFFDNGECVCDASATTYVDHVDVTGKTAKFPMYQVRLR